MLRAAPVFPVLMWVASLAVAFLAVDSLLLRPLARLSRSMRRFRADDDSGHFIPRPGAAAEIRDIADTYNRMVDRILADRQAMQATVREKDLLLREVHHRVKNNLQLIGSLISMQLRGVTAPETRRILARVQDRVMSLSTIHKLLYAGPQIDAVRADDLLREIVEGVMGLGLSRGLPVETRIDLQPVTLDADQAVPLSLLATEAMTNAVKHLGAPADGPARLRVALAEAPAGEVAFEISNTCVPAEAGACTDSDMPTLGARLIAAFASQLGGALDISEGEDRYRLVLRFAKHAADATDAAGAASMP
jgi:two-component sensor histidine kinase